MAVQAIDYTKCNDCGKCASICPMDVYQKVGTLCFISCKDDCMTCFLCEIECPTDAIFVGPERGHEVVLPY